MKFIGLDNRVVTIKADQELARLCYNSSLSKKKGNEPGVLEKPQLSKGSILMADLDVRAEQDLVRPKPQGTRTVIQLDQNPDHKIYLGSELPEDVALEITQLLQSNGDLFAWTSADMPGIDPNVSCHKLNIFPSAKPVAQKRRKYGLEKASAIEEKVAELL